MLTVENISFGYSPGEWVFTNLSFSVSEGDTVCLLGPNGAGKTSLLRCLLGISQIQSGHIKFRGKALCQFDAKDMAKLMAYVPQASTHYFSYRVIDIVVMGRAPYIKYSHVPEEADLNIALEAIERVGIPHLANKPINEISGGERQLALIARALTQQSRLLILDEPTANLDYGNQTRVLDILRRLARQGYTVIMTSHFPNHAFMVCNKVLLLSEGKIARYGSPEEIITDEYMSQLYGIFVKVTTTSINDESGYPIKVCIPLLR